MFREPDLCFKNAVAVEVLEQFIGYRVGFERDGEKSYVIGTVIHLARLDAWVVCVVTTMDAEAERGGHRQTLFPTFYAKHLPRAVNGILKTALEAVREIYAAEFENSGVRGEEGREVCGSFERRATTELRIPSTEMLHLAVRETYFMRNMTSRLGAVSDCYIASCGPEDPMFEPASRVAVSGEKVREENDVGAVGVVGGEESFEN